MNINKDKVTRIARLAVIVLASLLSILALTALASKNKSQREIADLLELYNPSEKPPEKDKNPNPNEKEGKKEGKKEGEKEGKKEGKKEDKKKKSLQELKVERIIKRLIFSVKKKHKGFSLKLAGILGKLVYFQGPNKKGLSKGFELGQTYKEAKIKRIGPDWVEVEFRGKMKMLYVFGKGGAVSKPSKSPPKPKPAGPAKAPPPEAIKLPEMPKMPKISKNMHVPSGFKITAEMIARFKSLSPEMQQQLLEQMPDNIREELEKKL